MGSDGRDAGYGAGVDALPAWSGVRVRERPEQGGPAEVVFDFTGLHRPGFGDLALILTARLQADAGERVWVRALPASTWTVLQALGLDHLFHVIPAPGKIRN